MQLENTVRHSTFSSALTYRSVRYRVRSITTPKQTTYTIAYPPKTASNDYQSSKLLVSTPCDNAGVTQRGISTSGTRRVQRARLQSSEKLVRRAGSIQPLQELKLIQKPSYFETVDMMLQLKQTIKADKQDWRGRNRISLPFVEESNPESPFITMDPIRIQIEYVQVQIFVIKSYIDDTTQELQTNRQCLHQLTGMMALIAPKFDKQFESIITELQYKRIKFENMLKEESVKHQQSSGSARQSITSINKSLRSLEEEFDRSLSRTQDMQQVIFRGLPYELIENAINLEPFNQKLF